MALALLFPPSLGHVAAADRAERLGDWLSTRLDVAVKVSVAADYETLERSIAAADVDLAWAPPAVCARVAARAVAVFKAVRGGRSDYCSAVVCRSRRIRSAADLRSRRAAWVDRLSAAGYLLAVAYLRQHGVDPNRDLAQQQFLGSYATAVRAVLRGDSDFTAVYAGAGLEADARRSLVELVGERARDLRVAAFTPAAPTDGLVIARRPDADRTLAAVERLSSALAGDPGQHLAGVLDAEGLVRAEPGDYAALDQPPT